MNNANLNEADRNYAAFEMALPSILSDHAGEFALIHREKIVEYFKGSLEATLSGLKRFGAGEYSVQEVTRESDNLGFYSYVGGPGDC